MPLYEAPPFVCKYLSPNRIDFFELPCLRFTPIQELNDPFESLISMYREDSDNLFSNLFRLAQIDMNAMLHSMLNSFARTGILSLTSENSNILMWSHYAGNHQGFVLEFDTKHDFFSKIDAVTYSNDRLYFDEIENSKDRNASLLYRNIFFKSTHWAYEKEWRLFKQFIHKLPEIKKGVAGLVECPLYSLKSIYLGLRASNELKDAATNFCRKHEHIKLYQSQLHQSKFELRFHEVPLG